MWIKLVFRKSQKLLQFSLNEEKKIIKKNNERESLNRFWDPAGLFKSSVSQNLRIKYCENCL